MSSKLQYASNSEFCKWCEENGYPDWDDWIDEDEEPYKRSVILTFYIRHENGTYAQISCTKDYDYGCENFNLEQEGLVRTEKEIIQKVVTYDKQ